MGKRGKLPTQPLPVKIVNDTVQSKPSHDEKRWRAEDALRDIERAEHHKRDKELMSHVKVIAKEKMANLSKVCK